MKFYPKKLLSCLASAFLGLLACCFTPTAMAQSAELEGTWRLVMRELPDGRKLFPPDVLGLSSYSKGNKNLNVVWKTPDGKIASISGLYKVRVAESEYSETVLYSRLVDPGHPEGMLLNVSGETRTVPLKREGRRIQYKVPFDPPMVTVEGDKLTAIAEGFFTDHWERVK
jgi:hypothetical protein